MHTTVSRTWSRRDFVRGVSAATSGTLLGLTANPAVAEPPPETTSIGIVFDPKVPVLCYGPQFVAKQMLHLEGFEEVRFAPYDSDFSDAKVLAAGDADISTCWAVDLVLRADQNAPVVALSGMHLGCYEIFASERVRAFRDLKGKRVTVTTLESPEHYWLAGMVAYIGLDPENDIEWIVSPYTEWPALLSSGEVDAVMLWPPIAQEFREKNIGHVIANSTTDRPWRDYFCCMVSGNRSFVDAHPVATKRALRAMLKATDLCAADPEGAARLLVESRFPFDYDRAVQVFREIPYAAWRSFDPADTLRFNALRLYEIGIIKHTPEAIVERHADWRYLDALRRELKA